MTKPRTSITRRGGLIVVLAVAFLPLGVPRIFGGDPPAGTGSAAGFAQLCRDHGGTPGKAPSTATNTPPDLRCTVRYGGQAYLMDAITKRGWDADTARFQRQGCEEEQRASGSRRQRFVYHPSTGVCEQRS